MDGSHETFLNPEPFFEENVDEWGETVGGTGGVGDDVMFGVVVLGVVHAHDDSDVFAFCGGGDNDLFTPSGDVAFCFVRFGKETGGLDDIIDA